MTSYLLNDFIGFIDSKGNDTRIEICIDADCYAKVLAYHNSQNIKEIPIYSLIPEKSVELPMPNQLFHRIDKVVSLEPQRTMITGLVEYMRLLDAQGTRDMWLALRSRLDQQKLNTVFVFSSKVNFYKDTFVNPKYVDAFQLVLLYDSSLSREEAEQKVYIAPRKWLNSQKYYDGYSEVLQAAQTENSPELFFIAVDDGFSFQAGLNADVIHIKSAREFSNKVYGFSPDLTEDTYNSLLSECARESVTPDVLIERSFGIDKINKNDAVRRLVDLKNSSLWVAYRWLLIKKISNDTLLSKALKAGETYDSFIEQYVVKCPIASLSDQSVNRYEFANERRNAIINFPILDNLIARFVQETSSIDSAFVYLNCGTTYEYCEIIRRCATLMVQTRKLPSTLETDYPQLYEYYSRPYSSGFKAVDSYFEEYRWYRLRNTVSKEFAEKAAIFEIPSEVKARDILLIQDSTNLKTGLIIADGLGAEYLPYIVSAANRLGYGIEKATVAFAKQPTTTSFNPISWPHDRLLKSSKVVDNNVHYGVEKNEISSYEEDLCVLLQKIEMSVIRDRVGNGLTQFEKVVLTADHGASRLAVLYANSGLANTIPIPPNPSDWRFTEEPEGHPEVPVDVREVYREDTEQTFWVSKGYSRFSKAGGKLHQLHGGGSPEEVLVPYIVFVKEKKESNSADYSTGPVNVVAEQLIEDADFDLL